MKIDIKNFEDTVKNIFAPIYPVIAQNIINEAGITSGVYLDIGTGFGNLGLEIAKIAPDINVVLLDISDEMLKKAENNCISMMLSDRVKVKKGNAEKLPFLDNTVDLIISRGSVFFWEDQVKAINEIYRVLKHGGFAYIGGGFGNEELFLQISKKMKEQNPEWENERKVRIGGDRYSYFTKIMGKTNVSKYEISRKDAGLWIIFRK